MYDLQRESKHELNISCPDRDTLLRVNEFILYNFPECRVSCLADYEIYTYSTKFSKESPSS